MPVVVKTASDAATLRVVAHMLNIEAGAVAYVVEDGRIAAAAPPHAPWPLVVVPPVTTEGRPWHVHYRASTGVVYHTANQLEEPALFDQLTALLAAAPAGHLAAPRAAFGTTTAVVRLGWHGPESTGETEKAIGLRRAERAALARRSLVRVNRPNAISHVSKTGPFVWYFAPVSVAATMCECNMTPPVVNALVAAVIYDIGGQCAWAEGDTPLTVTAADIRRANIRDQCHVSNLNIGSASRLAVQAAAVQAASQATGQAAAFGSVVAKWMTPRYAPSDSDDDDA